MSCRVTARPLAMALFAGAALASGLVAQAPVGQPPVAEEEDTASRALEGYAVEDRIDVDLYTVPFYAVDREGEPVYDLRPEEVELRIDGAPVAFDYFDRYGASEPVLLPRRPAAAGDGPAAASGVGERLLPLSTPRHVFVLFDLAFSTPRGLKANIDAARGILAGLPDRDWLYLVTYHTQDGFEQPIGPVEAGTGGRDELGSRIAGLEPNIERIRIQADLQPIVEGQKFASDNLADAYRDTQGIERGEYRMAALSLAQALESFAAFVRQVPGPKLILYFSQGINSTLYNYGVTALGSQRSRPIRMDFEPALEALGETGAMMLFVNAEVGAGAAFSSLDEVGFEADAVAVNSTPLGEDALHGMAEVTGGRVLAHSNTEVLSDRVLDWTAAYYELGFHPAGGRLARFPEAELRVSRPGVEVWVPKWVRAKREYRDLTRAEKRFLISDLVLHGPRARAVQELSNTTFFRLDGRFESLAAEGRRGLVFEASWPRATLLKGLELYSVVLAPDADAGSAELVEFDGRFFAPSGPSSTLEAELPADRRLLWGVVAVDAAENVVYVRRMLVQPEAATVEASLPNGGTGK